MPVSKNTSSGKWWWIPVFLCLILINYVASIFHKRLDLTNEKRFTLSSHVKKILGSLDDVVQIDVFLKGELPSGFKKLSGSADELLSEFKELANSKLEYRFITADNQMEDANRSFADTLEGLGIEPINLKVQLKAGEQSQLVYPDALVRYKNKLMPVILYPGTQKLIDREELNNAEALMEYHFANAIEKITQSSRPMIAYSMGNGEPTGANVEDLVENVLAKDYNVKLLNISTQVVIPDTFKLLLIVKPSIPFSTEEKIKIDQFIMRGGKTIWCIDRLNAETDSLQIKNQVVAYDRNLNLDDLFFKYGVRINPDLLMDLQCDFLPLVTNGKDQLELTPWNYFPIFTSRSNHIINKNLGLVSGKFVNSIDTVKSEQVVKTILLSSSANSRTISSPALISPQEVRTEPDGVLFVKSNITAAVLLEGKFTSLYSNRISRAMMDSMQIQGFPFQSSNISDNKMIIMGDGDIVLNSVSRGAPTPMGMNPYTMGTQQQFPFANRQFIQNCIEYLVNNSGLNEASAKAYTLRLIDKKRAEDEKLMWQLINIAVPILIVCLFGFVYMQFRRRKYRVGSL